MTSDLKVSRDSWSRAWVLTDIREFTTLFYVIFRRKSSEWLESSIESDLGMWFTIWNLDLAVLDFAFLKHCYWYMEQVIIKSIQLAYFRDSGKRNFYIRDAWSSIFPVVNRARDPPVRPSS